jgi:uncharacterized protein
VTRGSRLVFEWDAEKSERCLRERGFGFEHVIPAFNDPEARIEVDSRHDYGEDRFRMFGHVETRLYVIVYTMRQGCIRIISARKASQREQRRYGSIG